MGLRRVGVLWSPKPGAKSLGSGSITVNGFRQRFVIFRNDRKRNEKDPDYTLLSGDEPEEDHYAKRTVDDAQRTFDDAKAAPGSDDDVPL
jgi:hypothetical protein